MADSSLTSLLTDFGIDYPNAPAPTPALLAFMRGLGMNMATTEDVRRQGIGSIKSRTEAASDEVNRTAGRGKQNITSDLVRRGVLSSGEANTRFARQDEDVAARRSDIERGRTEATQAVENAYESAKGTYRQQALERVLNTEEQNATREATSKATEDSWKRQEDAAAAANKAQKEATDYSVTQMEELYKKYGQMGVAL